MITTNKSLLPEALAAALAPRRRPSPGSFTVGELIGPPQVRLLTVTHWDSLEIDAASRLRMFTDRLLHDAVERLGGVGGKQAERLRSYDIEDGLVAGEFDVFLAKGALYEFRSTSTWRFTGGVPQDWVERLNLYAEALRRAGRAVTSLTAYATFRDWSASRSRDANYPAAEVVSYDVPLWPARLAEDFLRERLALHLAAERGECPPCTPEERWEKPSKFALMKQGRKSAVRVYDDEGEARSNMTSEQHYIETRPGQSTRCEFFCRVAAVCPQRAAAMPPKGEEAKVGEV